MFPELDTPSILVELEALEGNISRMASIARAAGLDLRPHIKTHKSPAIAKMQLDAGASGVTVAKLGEAEVMVEHGIDDLLIAFPLVGSHKLERLAALARRAKIITSTDSVEVARGLSRVGLGLGKPISIYLEVDTGLGRCGYPPGEPTLAWARELRDLKGIMVTGVMTHEGHAWTARDSRGRAEIARQCASDLARTASMLREAGFPCSTVSVGSTPTAFHAEASIGATEMRPGTYVFNDKNVLETGEVNVTQCALNVLATVVGRPATDRVILDSGSKTLAQQAVRPGETMGFIIDRTGWRLERLTEEHGIVRVPPTAEVCIGERVRIIPNHVCVVTNLTDRMVTVRGDRVVGDLPVVARGMTQ